MFFTLLRIVYYSWDAQNFLTLNSFHLFLCCFIFVLLISPHSLWLPVQPSSHSGVVLQAEEPSQGSAVTSTPGCPRWHSHRNSTKSPAQSRSRGWSAAWLTYLCLLKCETGSTGCLTPAMELHHLAFTDRFHLQKKRFPSVLAPVTARQSRSWASWTHSERRLTAPPCTDKKHKSDNTKDLSSLPNWVTGSSTASHHRHGFVTLECPCWDSHTESCWGRAESCTLQERRWKAQSLMNTEWQVSNVPVWPLKSCVCCHMPMRKYFSLKDHPQCRGTMAPVLNTK